MFLRCLFVFYTMDPTHSESPGVYIGSKSIAAKGYKSYSQHIYIIYIYTCIHGTLKVKPSDQTSILF